MAYGPMPDGKRGISVDTPDQPLCIAKGLTQVRAAIQNATPSRAGASPVINLANVLEKQLEVPAGQCASPTGRDTQFLASLRSRLLLSVVLTTLAFGIYASTVLSLPQVRDAPRCCELASVAAAVSNVLYGAPLGSMYLGVYDFFFKHYEEPVGPTLAAVRAGALPATNLGRWVPTTRDGNGIGYPLVVTAAFRLFGVNLAALLIIMLILMAVSVTAFLCRFPYMAAVPILYFGVLTVMLFTPLVWDPSLAWNVPVGGIRYFSLVGVLPLFHILLELIDSKQSRLATRDATLLLIQTIIFSLAVLVRGSALPLLGAITVVGLALAWRHHRHSTGKLPSLIRKLSVVGITGLAFLMSIAVAVPREYLTDGRFGTVIWQRVTESLGINPRWPFSGLNDMFDCREYFPEGLVAGMDDNNGHCIYRAYGKEHYISVEIQNEHSFGSLFETALREAFFKIAAHYPREVLLTFFYYKPALIIPSVMHNVKFNLAGDPTRADHSGSDAIKRLEIMPYPPFAIGLLVASVVVAATYFGIATLSMLEIRRIAAVALLSAVFTIPSYIAVWAAPWTTADLLLYCLFLAGLAAGLAFGTFTHAIRALQIVQLFDRSRG